MSRLHRIDNEPIKKDIEARWKQHKEPRHALVKQIIIRREPDTKDHSGNPIVPFSIPRVDTIDLPMANEGETWEAFRRTAASVAAWLERELNQRLDAWNNHQSGPAPTRESVEKDLLGGRTCANADGAVAYSILYRSTTYPALTRLCEESHLHYTDLMASSVNTLASEVSQYLVPDNPRSESPSKSNEQPPSKSYSRSAALQVFKDSKFWNHIDLLRRDSPKYRHVASRINEMMDQNKKQEEDKKEHMVLFCLHPVSCLITTMLLLKDFPELRIRYIHASMPFQTSGSRHSRQAMIEALDDHVHHQVFILTYDLGSVGFNLQQANWLIQLEEANNHADKTQAPARVHRRGQTLETHLECLHDPRNIGEKSAVDKNANQGAMSRLDFSLYTNPQPSQDSG